MRLSAPRAQRAREHCQSGHGHAQPRWAVAALAGAVVAGAFVLPLDAQRGAVPSGATDVKAILFELGNSMGMLRGMQQEDSIITLEHWAAGTLVNGQQRSDVTDFRVSVNYAVPGMRVDVSMKGPGGQPQRLVQVISGNVAWNETEPGKNPTAAPDAVKERAARLWSTPMGVVKAARMAGANARVSGSGTEMTLTFPLPAPAADVMATATLRRDASLVKAHAAARKELVGTYITRVQTSGAVVSEATYSEYGDWNWDDYRSDIMLPHRVVWKSGTQTIDLTTKNTNTYNPYVVMPVPANIRAAASR
jgi:hypothetical protein